MESTKYDKIISYVLNHPDASYEQKFHACCSLLNIKNKHEIEKGKLVKDGVVAGSFIAATTFVATNKEVHKTLRTIVKSVAKNGRNASNNQMIRTIIKAIAKK